MSSGQDGYNVPLQCADCGADSSSRKSLPHMFFPGLAVQAEDPALSLDTSKLEETFMTYADRGSDMQVVEF